MPRMPMKSLAAGTALLLALTGCGAKPGTSGEASAEDYPTEPLTIVVESTPGSPVDVLARQIGKYSKKYLGESVVVENKTGGGSSTQLQAIKSKPAEGYVLGTATRSLMTAFNTTLEGKYAVDDFTFVSQLQSDPYVIAVNASSDVKDLDGLVAEAKKDKKYALGGFGAESAFSLLTDRFAEQAEFEPNYVPFDGGAAAVTAVLGDQIDAVVTNVSNVAPQVKAGKLRVLAVSADKPVATVGEDVPTFESLGYDDMVLSHWRGIFVKKGTPDAVVQKLDKGLQKMMQDPGFQQYMEKVGLEPGYLDTASFEKKVRTDVSDTRKQLAGQ